VNVRAVGCIVVGALVFILIGIAGLNLASSRAGCPASIGWLELSYEPAGSPGPSPVAGEGTPVKLGSTFIGLATRSVYGPAGTDPSASGSARPDVIALDCGDGTFQTYRVTKVGPPTSPGG
jgi:hypothetical protein